MRDPPLSPLPPTPAALFDLVARAPRLVRWRVLRSLSYVRRAPWEPRDAYQLHALEDARGVVVADVEGHGDVYCWRGHLEPTDAAHASPPEPRGAPTLFDALMSAEDHARIHGAIVVGGCTYADARIEPEEPQGEIP